MNKSIGDTPISNGLPPTNPNDLKSALECQIDIVLRLEEERLVLLKENRIQREKIRELTLKSESTLKKMTQVEKNIQTEATKTEDFEMQTENTLSESVMTESSEVSKKKSVVDEASEYISKYNDLMYSQSSQGSEKKVTKKKPLTEKMPMKSLKLNPEKENSRMSSNLDDGSISQVAKNLRNEKDILAQELINLNREITKLKTENRITNENFKRIDKERLELKKTLETKTDQLEKLKAENQEMIIILNTDQFKTIRNVETELKRVLGHNKELIQELRSTKEEKNRLEDDMQDFKIQLDVLTDEIERKLQEEKKAEKLIENNKKLEERIKELEHKYHLRDEEIKTKEATVEEMIRENQKLNDDIEYFKNAARTAKQHAEKAIADVDVYKKMLASK